MRIDGEEVEVYNDSDFARVREAYGLKEADFVFEDLEEGGGKGGMMMGFTKDKNLILKELNKADHKSLLKISKNYVTHILEGSLLTKIFLHFSRAKKNYIIMNNLMPPMPGLCSQFDLKGCADDKTLKREGTKVPPVHKRIFHPSMWLGKTFWSQDRKIYYEGKVYARKIRFPCSKEAHQDIIFKTQRDVAFLQEAHLMDYSLVVAHYTAKDIEPYKQEPYIAKIGDDYSILYLGIIDFLQGWTAAKVAAQCVKVMERNKATIPPGPYGDRFALFVRSKFDPSGMHVTAPAEDQD